MEYNEQDTDVIRLLTQLKEAEGSYPVEMMTSRRRGYVNQIAALAIGAGAGVALKTSAKGAGAASIPPTAGTILELALIVAIVVEVGAVAIINRKKILDLFGIVSSQPVVEQISTSTPPDSAVPLVGPTLIDTVEPTETAIGTFTAVSTPSPNMILATDADGAQENTEDGIQTNSTPAPNGNNGNHYGQTPIPARTKDSGGKPNPNRDNDNRDNRNTRR